MEDVVNEETFGYFNTDVNLLVLHILMEGFYRKQNIFTLDQFFKGDYWKIEEIQDEIRDTNDYGTAEELVAHQILLIINELKLGTVKRVSIDDVSSLMETAVREAVKTKNASDDDVAYYTSVMEQIYSLRRIKDDERMKALSDRKTYDPATYNRLDFKVGDFGKYLDGITKLSAPHIEIEIVFNDDQVKVLGEAIKDYIKDFSQDGYFGMGPIYKSERLYFSRQLENFYNFVKDIPVMNGTMDIPFSSLTEEGFEVIKVLSFLAIQKKIDVRNWNDTKAWNVKFHSMPITRQSLIAGPNGSNPMDIDLKTNLSFDEPKSILRIGDKTVKIRKKSDQYHLLRIIFENAKDIAQEWFYSDIAERYDGEAQFGDKKFYNAAYQVKQKIIRDTGIQDVLLTTNQSVQINQKYLNKT